MDSQQLPDSGSAVCDGDWDELLNAARGAGRQAARMLARRCRAWELGRTGKVWVSVGPTDSPLATWLWRAGRAENWAGGEIAVPISLDSGALATAAEPAVKARSLLVREAYARAWASVVAQECAAITSVHTEPDPDPVRHAITYIPAQPRPQGDFDLRG